MAEAFDDFEELMVNLEKVDLNIQCIGNDDCVSDGSDRVQDMLVKCPRVEAPDGAVSESFENEFGQFFLVRKFQPTDPRRIAVQFNPMDLNPAVECVEFVVGEVENADCVGAPVSNGGERLVGQLESAKIVIAEKGDDVGEGFGRKHLRESPESP